MTHLQSYTFDSPNFSTLTLSIVIPLRGGLAKSLPHHIHISERFFGAWEAVQREPIHLVDVMGLLQDLVS